MSEWAYAGEFDLSYARNKPSLDSFTLGLKNTHSAASIGKSFLNRYSPFAAMGLGVALLAVDGNVQIFSQSEEVHEGQSDNIFDPFEEWGTHKPYYYYIVPLFLTHGLLFNDRRNLLTGGEITVGLIMAACTTEAVKKVFGRLRPYETSDTDDFFHGGSSFFSAHTTTAFTFATILAKNYPSQEINLFGINENLPLIPIVSYSLAGMVGLQRIYGNDHWASDVYFGALAGYAIGSFVVNFGDRFGQVKFIPGNTPQLGIEFYLN